MISSNSFIVVRTLNDMNFPFSSQKRPKKWEGAVRKVKQVMKTSQGVRFIYFENVDFLDSETSSNETEETSDDAKSPRPRSSPFSKKVNSVFKLFIKVYRFYPAYRHHNNLLIRVL